MGGRVQHRFTPDPLPPTPHPLDYKWIPPQVKPSGKCTTKSTLSAAAVLGVAKWGIEGGGAQAAASGPGSAPKHGTGSSMYMYVSMDFAVNKAATGWRRRLVPQAPRYIQRSSPFKGAPLRLPRPRSDQFPGRVCSCPLCK